MSPRKAAEVRLAALLEARDAAVSLDQDPKNDPYLWGYGGSKIVEKLDDMVQAARNELKKVQS